MEGNLTIGDVIQTYFPEYGLEIPFFTADEQVEAWGRFLDLLFALSFNSVLNDPKESMNRIASTMGERGNDELFAPKERVTFAWREEVYDLFDTLVFRGYGSEGEPLYAMTRLLDGLSDYEKWLVIFSYICSSKAKYGRLLSQLQEGKKNGAEPTVGLAWDLGRFFLDFGVDETLEELEGLGHDTVCEQPFMPMGFFVQSMFRLPGVSEMEKGSVLFCPLRLSPTVETYLSGERGSETGRTGGASDGIAMLLPMAEDDVYIAQEDVQNELVLAIYGGYMASGREPFVIELCGDEGSGRRFLLNQAAGRLGMRVLAVDAGRLLTISTREREEACRDIVIKCILYNWQLYIYNVPSMPNEYENELYEMFAFMQEGNGVICIGSEKGLPLSMAAKLRGHHRKVEIAYPTPEIQYTLWEEFATRQGLVFPEGYDRSELVSKYAMNPGRIMEALFNTKLLLNGEEEIKIPLLEEQIRHLSAAEFEDNATRLSSPFGWDDLVVGSHSRHLLELACDRVRHSVTVNSTFGFGKKLPYGRGVAVVLYGPPGTGKTMAAQVMAKELNLDIYRVDLSQVSSKYIGETEKNLGAIFDAAKNSNAILFFDEADALFSKRTEVSSSNDKYANAETSYLLQKIEEYAGVSILATNNMQNFDVAFKRRMTFLIPLEAPDKATRENLWSKVFPPEAPLSAMVDVSLLAETLEVTGAQIKSIAVESAYMAAAAGHQITYEEIIEAADMECAKTGQLGVGNTLRSAIMTGGM